MSLSGRLFGKGIAFPTQINAEGRWSFSEGPENIRECIRIILSTEPGERVRLGSFGGGLRPYLFRPNTASTRRLIQDRIEQSLRRWEPRIKLQSVEVEVHPEDPRAAIATLRYRLIANQVTESMNLVLNLQA